MRITHFFWACALLAGPSAFAATPAPIAGDYVEARSNHVYTCNCLASGELVTDGREAILAWRFQEGEFRGASLRGAKAVAVIVAGGHLGVNGTARQTAIYLDAATSAEQQQALIELLRSRYADLLGEIASVETAPIRFEKDAAGFDVEIARTVHLVMRPARLPEDAHLGSFLWYHPFVPLASEELGTTLVYQYVGDHFARQWTSYEPSITGYMGTFALPGQ